MLPPLSRPQHSYIFVSEIYSPPFFPLNPHLRIFFPTQVPALDRELNPRPFGGQGPHSNHQATLARAILPFNLKIYFCILNVSPEVFSDFQLAPEDFEGKDHVFFLVFGF